MKKIMVVTFLCLVLTMAALPIAYGKIDKEKESIMITEEVLAGDPAAAAGITLQVSTCLGRGLHWRENGRLGGHLLWDTAYNIGSGERAESKFTFSAREINWEKQEMEPYISCTLLPSYGATFMGTAGEESIVYEDMLLADIVHDVAGRTEAGEERREFVRISDYYAYYPINGFEVHADANVRYEEKPYEEDYSAYLSEFFHISTEGDILEVMVQKSKEGNLAFVEVGMGETSRISVYGVSAFGEEGCYYTYICGDGRAREDVDRGQNSGIFYIPYVKEEESIALDLKQIRKMCELPEGMIPVKMLLDEENGRLYLGCRGEEAFYLAVYGIEQKVPVFREYISVMPGVAGEDGEINYPVWNKMTAEEGGILMTWQDNSFAFVTEEDGRHRLWCSGSFPADGREENGISPQVPGYEKLQAFLQSRSMTNSYSGYNDYKQTIQNGNDSFTYGSACLFDGERLVLAALVNWRDANVLLSVYREDGLAYCGLYRHSGTQQIYIADRQNTVQPQGAPERGCVRLQASAEALNLK